MRHQAVLIELVHIESSPPPLPRRRLHCELPFLWLLLGRLEPPLTFGRDRHRRQAALGNLASFLPRGQRSIAPLHYDIIKFPLRSRERSNPSNYVGRFPALHDLDYIETAHVYCKRIETSWDYTQEHWTPGEWRAVVNAARPTRTTGGSVDCRRCCIGSSPLRGDQFAGIE